MHNRKSLRHCICIGLDFFTEDAWKMFWNGSMKKCPENATVTTTSTLNSLLHVMDACCGSTFAVWLYQSNQRLKPSFADPVTLFF